MTSTPKWHIFMRKYKEGWSGLIKRQKAKLKSTQAVSGKIAELQNCRIRLSSKGLKRTHDRYQIILTGICTNQNYNI